MLSNMTRITIAAGWVALASLVVPPAAQAVLEIKITQGIEGAQPVAIVPFGWQGPPEGPPAPCPPPEQPPTRTIKSTSNGIRPTSNSMETLRGSASP